MYGLCPWVPAGHSPNRQDGTPSRGLSTCRKDQRVECELGDSKGGDLGGMIPGCRNQLEGCKMSPLMGKELELVNKVEKLKMKSK